MITRETPDNKVVYGYNGHGDVVNYTNVSGKVLQLYSYDEFGNVVLDAYIGIIRPFLDLDQAEDGEEPFFPELRLTQIDNPYRYAGYEYLEEVKLYDLNARYYNPEIARFLSQDPYYNLGNRVIGLYEINVPNAWSIVQANNIYIYCGNCPIVIKDSAGYYWETLFDIGSTLWSLGTLIVDPSWENAGNLLWDAGSLLLPIPGSYAGKALGKVDDVIDAGKAVSKVDNVVDAGKAVDKTKDVSKVVGNAVETWGKDASSKVLRENMIAAGKNVPDYSNAAHHIVAGKAANAEGARQILEKFDIDINHSGNGVFLPTQKGVSDAAYHPSLHTDAYYQNVTDILSEATSREEALNILGDIAEELQKGVFPK